MKQRPVRFFLCGFLAVVSLAWTGTVRAQLCLGTDGLTGTCCTTTTVTVPTALPVTTLQSVGICWSSCVPSTDPVVLDISQPTPVWCGAFQTQLTVTDNSGLPILSGLGTLDYTRTWTEFNDDGDELQVWRMMVKADLMLAGTTAPCPVPICLSAAPTAFFYGHIDFAHNCNSGIWEVSASLFHSCDRFIHHPASSSIPGTYHPDITYAVVGPDVPANPFVPANLAPIAGPITGGAVRRVAVPGAACRTEEPLPAGSLGLNLQGCACPLSPTPTQNATQPFTATGSCGGAFNAMLTPNPHWWKRMITTSLGMWTGSGPGTPYPGDENLRVNEGFFFYTDGCTSNTRIESFYGVTTSDGFTVVPDAQRPWLTEKMIDLAGNFDSSNGLNPPYVGNVMTTSHTIHANF